MDLQKQLVDGYCVVEVAGDIDTGTSATLQACLEEELAQGNKQFIIDLTNTRYVSSMGLRVFLSHLKKLKASNGSMILSGCNALITDVLRMSGFLNYFQLTANTSEALKLSPSAQQ